MQTTHSTVVRFRQPLANPAALRASLRAYQEHDFGAFEVTSVELVFNDWYQRAAHTVLLEEYPLPS